MQTTTSTTSTTSQTTKRSARRTGAGEYHYRGHLVMHTAHECWTIIDASTDAPLDAGCTLRQAKRMIDGWLANTTSQDTTSTTSTSSISITTTFTPATDTRGSRIS